MVAFHYLLSKSTLFADISRSRSRTESHLQVQDVTSTPKELIFIVRVIKASRFQNTEAQVLVQAVPGSPFFPSSGVQNVARKRRCSAKWPFVFLQPEGNSGHLNSISALKLPSRAPVNLAFNSRRLVGNVLPATTDPQGSIHKARKRKREPDMQDTRCRAKIEEDTLRNVLLARS